MSLVTVRRAGAEDVAGLVALYQETQRWLASIGSDQWARNTADRTRTRLSESIERGECYVGILDEHVVGMVTVDTYADPEFWSSDDSPGCALYVHRMVVSRSAAGRAVGAALLDWAEAVAESSGKTCLRLDAWKTNAALHVYYEKQGFTRVRNVDLAHRGSGALFERPVRRHRDKETGDS